MGVRLMRVGPMGPIPRSHRSPSTRLIHTYCLLIFKKSSNRLIGNNTDIVISTLIMAIEKNREEDHREHYKHHRKYDFAVHVDPSCKSLCYFRTVLSQVIVVNLENKTF